MATAFVMGSFFIQPWANFSVKIFYKDPYSIKISQEYVKWYGFIVKEKNENGKKKPKFQVNWLPWPEFH